MKKKKWSRCDECGADTCGTREALKKFPDPWLISLINEICDQFEVKKNNEVR